MRLIPPPHHQLRSVAWGVTGLWACRDVLGAREKHSEMPLRHATDVRTSWSQVNGVDLSAKVYVCAHRRMVLRQLGVLLGVLGGCGDDRWALASLF